ncbi:DDE-type integrase/transposase/recombinase [Chroococcidiopsis sp. CCMEE 29]|uniref:DDE-type integrase/transposase/recombinase n=1 Tax=Chroococcidiopsis sp. CCMEE 29 TaxID=155894 RepID=UPI0031F760C4
MINVDKNAAYPKADDELKVVKDLTSNCELRQNKYLNNMVEPDHRSIKKMLY